MKTSMMICFLGIFCFGCDHNSVGPAPGPSGYTAKHKLGDVNSLVESYGKGLRLMTVMSKDIAHDGTSEMWQYQYADTSWPPSAYWLHSTSTTVAFDSNSAFGVGSAAITHKWFDSDSALGFAERNGGSQFRNNNPHYTIVSSVGEPVVPNPTTSWWITYRSKDDNTKLLMFTIDANTGATKIYGSD
jgi:hypothetical protein